MNKHIFGLLALAVCLSVLLSVFIFSAIQPEARLGGTTRADTTVAGSFTTTGAATLSGTNTLSGATTLSGTNTVSGATTISGTVAVSQSSSSTLVIGNQSSGTGVGCLVVGDSAGATSSPVYITATGATLSATTTKPSICK